MKVPHPFSPCVKSRPAKTARLLICLVALSLASVARVEAKTNKHQFSQGKILDASQVQHYAEVLSKMPRPANGSPAAAPASGMLMVESDGVIYITSEPVGSSAPLMPGSAVEFYTEGNMLHILDHAGKDRAIEVVRVLRDSQATQVVAARPLSSLPAAVPPATTSTATASTTAAAPRATAPVRTTTPAPAANGVAASNRTASSTAAPASRPAAMASTQAAPPPPRAAAPPARAASASQPLPAPAPVAAATPVAPAPARAAAAPGAVPVTRAQPSTNVAVTSRQPSVIAPASRPASTTPRPSTTPPAVRPNTTPPVVATLSPSYSETPIPPQPNPIPTGTGPHLPSESVVIESSPSGAEVLIDRQVVGTTPFLSPVIRGVHQVTLMKGGFNDWMKTVVISETQLHLNATLQEQTASK